MHIETIRTTIEFIALFYGVVTFVALYRTRGEVFVNWPLHLAQVVQGKYLPDEPVIDFAKYPRKTK